MPVRIYEIAKSLGIPSKQVLAKAQELELAGVKVASSSLDKITAEFLENHLRAELEPGGQDAVVEAPTEPVHEPVVIVTESPVEEIAAEPAEPEVEEIASSTEAAEEVSESPAPPADLEIQEPQGKPVAKATLPEPQQEVAMEEPASEPVQEQVPEVQEEPADFAEETDTAEPEISQEEPAPEETEPAEPEAPKVGQKIGFINLEGLGGARGGRGGRNDRRAAKVKGRKDAPAAGNPPGGPAGGNMGQARKPQAPTAAPKPKEPKINLPSDAPKITMKAPIVVRDVAERLKIKPHKLIADLMETGVFANVNATIEEPTAKVICAKYGFRFEMEKRAKGEGHSKVIPKLNLDPEDKEADLQIRPPVVTIMGHVDHGKTTLLDVIRKSDVVSSEAGAITQHIGAYTITVPHPERPKDLQQITFLDTPGHAAFSAMRARGADVTDIVVLVVAANDGVMPQTIEALNHAKAANVPIIVAVNKMDHPAADPLKPRTQLQEHGLLSEEWGGDTIYQDVSALKGTNIDKLLELILLQAEIMELKANPNRRAVGNVVESGLDRSGPTATLLIRKGTLKLGDAILCNTFYGKARALIDAEGNRIKSAGPSCAVKLLGLNGVPEAGAEFTVLDNEKLARSEAEKRAQEARAAAAEVRRKVSLESFFSSMKGDAAKVLKVVVKADTQGSVEAICDSLNKIKSDKVSLQIIHQAVGSITESDVMLASASSAVVMGFHTRIDTGVADIGKREGVQIKLYTIIYELVDHVKDAMAGLLDPELREVVTGNAEVRQIFTVAKGIKIAGCMVTNGRITRGKVRVLRRDNLIYEGITQTLKRFQDEVNEVRSGFECGIRLDGFEEFEEGDVLQCYTTEKIAQKL